MNQDLFLQSLFNSFHEIINYDLPYYTHIADSLKPFLLTNLFNQPQNKNSFVVPFLHTDICNQYADFFDSMNIPYFIFPFYDLLPYEEEIITPSLLQKRMQTLFHVLNKTKAIYLVPLKSLLFPVFSISTFKKELSKILCVGQKINRQDFINSLVYWGYTRSAQIEGHASFAIRGEIIDIFSPQYENPFRIYFFDTEIEKIRFFSLDETIKVSDEDFQSIEVLSLYDFIFTPQKKDYLVDHIKKEFSVEKSRQFQEISTNQYNIHLAPFFYAEHSILNLFQESTHPFSLVLDSVDLLKGGEKNIQREVKEMFYNGFNAHKVMSAPSQYLISLEKIIEISPSIISINSFVEEEVPHNDFSSSFSQTPSYSGKIDLLQNHIKSTWIDYTINILVQSDEEKKRLEELFPEFKCLIYDTSFGGFVNHITKQVFLTGEDIFGKKIRRLKHHKTFLENSSPIESFSEINTDDFVVHVQHGIGIYKGIEKMSILGKQKDYIKIIYADEEALYIPVEQISLVHKYLGTPNPALSNLGGKKWEQRKERVAKKMEEMAEELALLYETRKQIKGFSYPLDSPFQKNFDATFPFEETEGQLSAIEDIKNDMQSPFVMDRLVCGDVGYGKTEVAMRALFKAVSAGKQTAMLAPTTLLVEQHYQNLLKRFQNFPVTIKMLSRLVPASEQKKTLASVKLGEVDILVGTHSLLAESVVFKDLGLLVVDEEQRFGVRHKERIKQMKHNIDVLTLSATPIPRTLYMGLSSLRDMSLITTPPTARLPIKTHVMPFNDNIIKLGIQRELDRGGQVFIVHNRVKTIDTFATFVRNLCPQARVIIGHAQMDPSEMEEVFLSFIKHGADILICTTIIENGIDIPNANTIIIDRPELLGLSDLYQLRGRVGRGDRQGYAYLFYDSVQGITPIMQKRLETIEENSELGSGFQVAMRDLEIRGAGNLLGKDQSGLFEDVGIELYTKILKRTMNKVKGNLLEEIEPLLDLPYNGYIPENYVLNENERFSIYKTLMRAQSITEIDSIVAYLEKQHGKIPATLNALFFVAKIKLCCKQLKMNELKLLNDSTYMFYFAEKPAINTSYFVDLVQKGIATILNPQSISIKKGVINPKDDFLEELLEILTALNPHP